MTSLKNKALLAAAVLVLSACQVTQVQPTRQPTQPAQQAATLPPPHPAGAQLAPTVEEQPGVVPTFPPSAAPATATPAAEQPKIGAKNAAALKQVGQVSFDNPARLVWSPDGSILSVISNDKMVRLDSKTLENKGSVVFKSPIVLLDFSADGRTMASTSDQATVELRDVTTGQTLSSLKPTAPFSSLAFSPDGKSMALTSVDEIAATLWNVDSGKQTGTLNGFQTAAPVYDVSFTPDGKSMVWHARALVQIMDIASQK